MEIPGWNEVESVMVMHMIGGWVRMELVCTVMRRMKSARELHPAAEPNASAGCAAKSRTRATESRGSRAHHRAT
jgi:hypothetical protein